MKVEQTNLAGLLVVEPQVFTDSRGSFFETYNLAKYKDVGIEENFVQVNQSKSSAGILRGMHFQVAPHIQSKLVRCISGKIFDVAVDIRRDSVTFGKWFGVELSGDNNLQLYVPRGFAHGFYVMEDCVVEYFCGFSFYEKNAESGLLYSDPAVGIKWPFEQEPMINDRDKNFSTLENLSALEL